MTTYAAFTLGAELLVTAPQKIIRYALQYYIASMKSAANVGYAQSISLVDTLSRYGGTRDAVAAPIQQEFATELTRYFPTALVEVDVTTETVDSDTYTLVISPSVTLNGLVYTIDKSVMVSNGMLVSDNDTVTPVYQ